MTVWKTLEAFFMIILAQQVCCEDWTLRTWIPNINYNNSHNWDIGQVPCESDRVIFQRSESIVLELPEGQTLMRELVLPSYMELLLPKRGTILLTGTKTSSSCSGQDAVFRPTQVTMWTDPQNWDGWTKATPDLERIPCSTQSVRFPRGSTFRVLVTAAIKIGTLEVNGVVMDSTDWYVFANSEGGARQFFKSDQEPADLTVIGDACLTSQWCECGNEYLGPQICTWQCPVPLCREPIQPAGFCCPFCGAYFLLRMESLNKNLLSKHIKSFLQNKKLTWHASRVKELVQVVLVEDGEYIGKVSATAEELQASLANMNLGWTAQEFHASGHVWYPTTFGQVVGHFFSLFLFAALVLATIVVVLSQDWSWIRMRLSSTLESRPFVFARFENQTEEVTVASEERREASVDPQQQAFDNPMYGATTQGTSNLTLNDPVYTELEETLRSAKSTGDSLLDSTNFSD